MQYPTPSKIGQPYKKKDSLQSALPSGPFGPVSAGGTGSELGFVETFINKLETCKTAEEVLAVVNIVLTAARDRSIPFSALYGPIPVDTAADIGIWLRKLRLAAEPLNAGDAAEIFAQVYAVLRMAARKLDAIDD